MTEKQLSEQPTKSDPGNKRPFIIKHNLKSNDLPGIIHEFVENDQRRSRVRKNQIALNHTIISFGIGDTGKITDKMLRAIARQYIELRSPNSLYCGTKHTDRNHIHLHLAMSSCDLSGRSNRKSRKEYAELKFLLQDFQKRHYPELTHSIVQHGKSKNLEYNKPLNIVASSSRMTQKETLLRSLEAAQAGSKSLQEFLDKLQPLGYSPYYRGQERRLTGLQLSNGRKFRFERLGFGSQVAEFKSLQEKQDKELRQLRGIRSRSHNQEPEQEQDYQRSLDEPIAIGMKKKNEGQTFMLQDCVYTD